VITFGSLFSGIGGLDLGLERAGMECAWQVEIDPYCRQVLQKHWPNVPKYDDVRTFTPTAVDVVAGGFPCQDVSVAGPKVGIDGPRSGLWGELHRIICEVRPRCAIVENTAGLLVRGLNRVLGDLARIGYDAEWGVLSSCRFGAPHVRQRVFIVAYPASQRQGQLRRIRCEEKGEKIGGVHWSESKSGIQRELDGVPYRMERCRGIGNAVDPRVAEWIGCRVVEILLANTPETQEGST
jgi:DNA (cytosine-5)-methyltransferase 1